MLALGNGKLLELASDFVNGQSCKAFFRVGALGGVRASLGNISVKKGETGKADIP